MGRAGSILVAALLAACSQGEGSGPAAKSAQGAETAQTAAPIEEPASAPAQASAAQTPAPTPPAAAMDMSPTDSMPQCRAGLKAKGLSDAELEIMLGPMAGVCPNNGVSEGRIREILTTIWTQAGCHQHGPIEVAHALDSGACGGDAG